MRITVRVRPGAARTVVGGRYGDPSAGEPALVVRVSERAVEGAATAAVVDAVATAFEVRRGDVRLISGERSRTKVLEISPEPPDARERLSALLGPG